MYVVGVPIGHSADITIRAQEVLTSVECIFCEDRRQTQELFKRAKIETRARLICVNEHLEEQSESLLTQLQQQGHHAAFVTDAGTPSISDPGSFIVSQAHKLGIRVIPIPGASALTTFLSAIGAPSLPVYFRGFLPKKIKAREQLLEQPIYEARLSVFFESPRRIESTLEILRNKEITFPLYLGREMTKTYEQFLIIDSEKLRTDFEKWLIPKGEFVLGMIEKPRGTQTWQQPALELNQSMGVKQTASFISKHFNVNKNQVYRFLTEYRTDLPPCSKEL